MPSPSAIAEEVYTCFNNPKRAGEAVCYRKQSPALAEEARHAAVDLLANLTAPGERIVLGEELQKQYKEKTFAAGLHRHFADYQPSDIDYILSAENYSAIFFREGSHWIYDHRLQKMLFDYVEPTVLTGAALFADNKHLIRHPIDEGSSNCNLARYGVVYLAPPKAQSFFEAGKEFCQYDGFALLRREDGISAWPVTELEKQHGGMHNSKMGFSRFLVWLKTGSE